VGYGDVCLSDSALVLMAMMLSSERKRDADALVA